MEAGCVLLLLLPFILGGKRHTPPPHSFPYIFSLKKNLGHMPQRNAKCFNSFAPFLSGCHLQGLSLCPEVICSGWTIKAIMAAACFPIMKRDDWQQRDGVGVEGTWIQFIWSENIFFIHLSNKTQTNSSGYLFGIFFFFLNKSILSNSPCNIFQLPFSPSWPKWLRATVRWCRTENASNVTKYWEAWQAVMCSN